MQRYSPVWSVFSVSRLTVACVKVGNLFERRAFTTTNERGVAVAVVSGARQETAPIGAM